MRKSGICVKCSHDRLLAFHSLPDVGNFNDAVREQCIGVKKVGGSILGRDELNAIGELSAVMCRRCGYVEHYVRDPGAIVPDGRYIVELSPPKTGAPFR